MPVRSLAARGSGTQFPIMAYTSQCWRQRAQHARTMTDRLRGARAKVAMMILAMEYEMLAVRAQQRELAQKLARHRDSRP